MNRAWSIPTPASRGFSEELRLKHVVVSKYQDREMVLLQVVDIGELFWDSVNIEQVVVAHLAA